MDSSTSFISSLLDLKAERPASYDYINNKKQFQLHSLITEQRHKYTWNLSQVLGNGTISATADGLR